MTHDELQSATKKHKQAENKFTVIFLTTAYGPMFVTFAILAPFFKQWSEDAPLRVVLVGCVAAIVVYFATVALMRWAPKRFPLPQTPTCPKCKRNLCQTFTLATGLCYCGHRIFDLPTTQSGEAFTPLECEPVAALAKKFNRHGTRGLLGGFVLFLLVFIIITATDSFNKPFAEKYKIILMILFFSSLFSPLICLVYCAIRYSVKCPACKKSIEQHWLLLSTRVCPRCGKLVLLPRKDVASAPPLPRAEWEARFKEMQKPFKLFQRVKHTCQCPQCGGHVYHSSLLLETKRCPQCGGKVVE